MKIGLLQAGHLLPEVQRETGDYDSVYGRLLAGEGIELVTYPVVDMVFPRDVHEQPGWLISGSRFGAYDDVPFIAPLEAFIRNAYEAGVPMVGICFGHQIIAQALGGRVEKFAGGWSVGRTEYAFEDETLALNAWHQDQVIAAPPGARVIASGPDCAIAGLVYGKRAFSVQAHPEFDSRLTELLLDHAAPGKVPRARAARARDALGAANDNAVLAKRIGAFFKEAAHV